ncbi:MAG: DUF4926 domain-containing protein [bacterium]|nr:DUF4926 domain-containing protein [bacterium]
MAYPLFTRVVLREDFPEYRLYRGDVATIVDKHEGEETGYSLEVFNAVGETIIVVEESKLEPLKKSEIFHVRQLDEAVVA